MQLSNSSQVSSDHETIFKAYYIRGKIAFHLEDYKTALINLNNAQIISESSSKVFICKAMCYIQILNYKKAKEELENINEAQEVRAKDVIKLKQILIDCKNEEICEVV